MKPKKSSYTFVTIPSPVVLPEAAVSAATTPAAVAAAPSQDDVSAVVSLTEGEHTTPAAPAPSTAVAAGAADPSLSADAVAAAISARDATTPFSPAAATASSLFAGGAAAGRAPSSAATGWRAAHRPADRRGRSRGSMSEESDKAALRRKVLKSRSEARAASLLRRQRSGSDTAEEQQEGDFGVAPVAGPSEVAVGRPMSCSTNGNALGVAPASHFSTDVHVASKVSAGQHGLTRRPQSSMFLPEACRCGSDDSVPTVATDAAPAEPAGHAAAPEEHNTRRRSQQRGSKGRQDDRSSSSPGVTVPSFADAALPPLAVEDAAVMLREFATMLQRLEYSGDEVLQEQKRPHSTRVRHQVRQRLSPQEQLQQQAVVCSSLSARLQRLFEANAADTAQQISPGTSDTVAGSPGECLPQKKLRHQLRLPGIGSRAGIQETGSGEEGWPDGGSSNRVALRTLATFSTIGSNSSVSFELAQAHRPPGLSSLEQHRGRLRLAKLKEDFERLQQKHERLVTMFNIRMLLPLSRRSSTGGCHSVENSSAAPSPEWAGAGSSSTRSEVQGAATGDHALSTHLAAGGNGDSESAAAGGASGLRSEAAATPADTGIILDGLDFSHFADCAGVAEGRCAGTPTPLSTRRRHSSNMILRRGGASNSLHHLASGGVGGACTPLHSLLRYNTSGTSSSGCSGGGGSVGRQLGLRCRTESGFSRFYSFNDPNSFSFGDSLLPIYVGPTHEWGAGKSVVGGAGASASRRALSAQAIQPRQEHQRRQGGADDSRKAPADLGARWRRGESPVLFPGEASLESMWRPSRLQEIDEGFEEQQRREQLQQLRHIEECVHVLHELHVQVADEVEAADQPLAAVAAETDAAAAQTAQANRELVTANLRRSRWWGVQGGGVAAAAGVVVGGLAGGPIGAAVGLIFGAFVGAASGSALEREHRHKLSRLVTDKTRRRRKEVKQGEQHTQTSSRDIPAVGADQQRQVFRGEQELVSRARDCQTAERRSDLAGGDDRPVCDRATAETRRAQRKGELRCAKQHLRMKSEQFPFSRITLPQKADSAAHLGGAEWQQQQQRREECSRRYPQGRFVQRDVALQDSYAAASSSSSFAVTHSRGTTGAGATDSRGDTGNHAVTKSTTTTGSSRAASRTRDARASNRRGGGQEAEHAATRRRDEHRSANVPLPALLGLGWGGSSVWYPDRKSREAVGPQSANRGSTTLRRTQGNSS